MKAIVYSLFDGNNPNSFTFDNYLQSFLICLRMNKVLYPEWTVVLETDITTNNKFHDLFSKLPIVVEVNEPAALCKAMLWRMKPVFNPVYSHVICRDTDSPPTWREVQCVTYWLNSGKAAHAITDSVSHTIPLMGGMIGFMPAHFTDYTGLSSWDQLFEGESRDWSIKGTDQDLLNRKVYPYFAQHGKDSITQHYIKGMPNTFLSDYHNTVPDYGDYSFKDADDVAGHIGAAGYYPGPTMKFLKKHPMPEIEAAERLYPKIFYWND
jgi:hypothetical protein